MFSSAKSLEARPGDVLGLNGKGLDLLARSEANRLLGLRTDSNAVEMAPVTLNIRKQIMDEHGQFGRTEVWVLKPNDGYVNGRFSDGLDGNRFVVLRRQAVSNPWMDFDMIVERDAKIFNPTVGDVGKALGRKIRRAVSAEDKVVRGW